MTSIPNNALVASRQLTSRPSGSYEINAREYGTVAASAIGLTQAVYQGAENAVSSIVSLSEEGLQALENGASSVGHALSEGAHYLGDAASSVKHAVVSGAESLASGVGTVVDEIEDVGSTVAGYVSAGAVAGRAIIDEIL